MTDPREPSTPDSGRNPGNGPALSGVVDSPGVTPLSGTDHPPAAETLAEEASRAFEEVQPDAPIDRSEVIAEGLREFAAWCLRLLIVSAAACMVGFVLLKFWQGVLPVVLALIVSSVLHQPASWLRRHRVPAAPAAIITILGTIALFGVVIALMAPSVARQSQALYYQAFEGVQRVQLWLQDPPVQLQGNDLGDWLAEGATWMQNQASAIAGEIFAGLGIASTILIMLGIVLVLTFFFLKDGDRFLPWMREVTGPRVGWHLTELLTRAWNTLSGFIRAQAIVALLDAVFIGLGLVLLGVPMALVLALLTFIAGFIPIIGAVAAGALAVLIAFVSLGVTEAVVVLVLVIIVQQVEGYVLSPWLQSRAMNLHPVIVLVSVTVGGGLFGIIGAFLAVPTAAMVAVLLRYLSDMVALRAGEKTADEIVFATVAGSLTARHGEEAGRRMRAARRSGDRFSSGLRTAEAGTDMGASPRRGSPTAPQNRIQDLTSKFVHIFDTPRR
ncbi:AI-2E family transporter [Corynebacterium sp. CCM 9204]|uniref:AI-2E family transporter n=1 Tax=Corynebacterium sp. CCM 9204 TaxID=3057616 RepID=UPI003523F660